LYESVFVLGLQGKTYLILNGGKPSMSFVDFFLEKVWLQT